MDARPCLLVTEQSIVALEGVSLENGIFTYMWLKFMVNVGKYSIHGAYGHDNVISSG